MASDSFSELTLHYTKKEYLSDILQHVTDSGSVVLHQLDSVNMLILNVPDDVYYDLMATLDDTHGVTFTMRTIPMHTCSAVTPTATYYTTKQSASFNKYQAPKGLLMINKEDAPQIGCVVVDTGRPVNQALQFNEVNGLHHDLVTNYKGEIHKPADYDIYGHSTMCCGVFSDYAGQISGIAGYTPFKTSSAYDASSDTGLTSTSIVLATDKVITEDMYSQGYRVLNYSLGGSSVYNYHLRRSPDRNRHPDRFYLPSRSAVPTPVSWLDVWPYFCVPCENPSRTYIGKLDSFWYTEKIEPNTIRTTFTEEVTHEHVYKVIWLGGKEPHHEWSDYTAYDTLGLTLSSYLSTYGYLQVSAAGNSEGLNASSGSLYGSEALVVGAMQSDGQNLTSYSNRNARVEVCAISDTGTYTTWPSSVSTLTQQEIDAGLAIVIYVTVSTIKDSNIATVVGTNQISYFRIGYGCATPIFPDSVLTGVFISIDNIKTLTFTRGATATSAAVTLTLVSKQIAYSEGGGTSFATPQVAALACMVWSINPDLTAQEVRKIIRDTCVQVSDPWAKTNINFTSGRTGTGAGLINIEAALKEARRVSVDVSSYVATSYINSANMSLSTNSLDGVATIFYCQNESINLPNPIKGSQRTVKVITESINNIIRHGTIDIRAICYGSALIGATAPKIRLADDTKYPIIDREDALLMYTHTYDEYCKDTSKDWEISDTNGFLIWNVDDYI